MRSRLEPLLERLSRPVSPHEGGGGARSGKAALAAAHDDRMEAYAALWAVLNQEAFLKGGEDDEDAPLREFARVLDATKWDELIVTNCSQDARRFCRGDRKSCDVTLQILGWFLRMRGSCLSETVANDANDTMCEVFFQLESMGSGGGGGGEAFSEEIKKTAIFSMWCAAQSTTSLHDAGRVRRLVEMAVTGASNDNAFHSNSLQLHAASSLRRLATLPNSVRILRPHIETWALALLNLLFHPAEMIRTEAANALSAGLHLIWRDRDRKAIATKALDASITTTTPPLSSPVVALPSAAARVSARPPANSTANDKDKGFWSVVLEWLEYAKTRDNRGRRLHLSEVLGLLVACLGPRLRDPDMKINALMEAFSGLLGGDLLHDAGSLRERINAMRGWRVMFEDLHQSHFLFAPLLKLLLRFMREAFKEGREPSGEVRREAFRTWTFFVDGLARQIATSAAERRRRVVTSGQHPSSPGLNTEETASANATFQILRSALGDLEVSIRTDAAEWLANFIALENATPSRSDGRRSRDGGDHRGKVKNSGENQDDDDDVEDSRTRDEANESDRVRIAHLVTPAYALPSSRPTLVLWNVDTVISLLSSTLSDPQKASSSSLGEGLGQASASTWYAALTSSSCRDAALKTILNRLSKASSHGSLDPILDGVLEDMCERLGSSTDENDASKESDARSKARMGLLGTCLHPAAFRVTRGSRFLKRLITSTVGRSLSSMLARLEEVAFDNTAEKDSTIIVNYYIMLREVTPKARESIGIENLLRFPVVDPVAARAFAVWSSVTPIAEQTNVDVFFGELLSSYLDHSRRSASELFTTLWNSSNDEENMTTRQMPCSPLLLALHSPFAARAVLRVLTEGLPETISLKEAENVISGVTTWVKGLFVPLPFSFSSLSPTSSSSLKGSRNNAESVTKTALVLSKILERLPTSGKAKMRLVEEAVCCPLLTSSTVSSSLPTPIEALVRAWLPFALNHLRETNSLPGDKQGTGLTYAISLGLQNSDAGVRAHTFELARSKFPEMSTSVLGGEEAGNTNNGVIARLRLAYSKSFSEFGGKPTGVLLNDGDEQQHHTSSPVVSSFGSNSAGDSAESATNVLLNAIASSSLRGAVMATDLNTSRSAIIPSSTTKRARGALAEETASKRREMMGEQEDKENEEDATLLTERQREMRSRVETGVVTYTALDPSQPRREEEDEETERNGTRASDLEEFLRGARAFLEKGNGGKFESRQVSELQDVVTRLVGYTFRLSSSGE